MILPLEIETEKAEKQLDNFAQKAIKSFDAVAGKGFSAALGAASGSLNDINKLAQSFANITADLPEEWAKVGKAVGEAASGLASAASRAKDWATTGAAIGSVIPGIGTGVGAIAGSMASIALSAWEWHNRTEDTRAALKGIYDDEKKHRAEAAPKPTADELAWQKAIGEHDEKVKKATEANMSFSRSVEGVGESEEKTTPKIKGTTSAIKDQTAAIEARVKAELDAFRERQANNSATTLDTDSGRTQEDIDEITSKLKGQTSALEDDARAAANAALTLEQTRQAEEALARQTKATTDVFIEQALAMENFLLGSAGDAINQFYDNIANRERLSAEDRKRRRVEWLRDMGSFLVDDGTRHVLAGSAKLAGGDLLGGTEISAGLIEAGAGLAVGGVGAIGQRRLGGTEGSEGARGGREAAGASAPGDSRISDPGTQNLQPWVIKFETTVPMTERQQQEAAENIDGFLRKLRRK